jgi:tetratricopeptide (TPR) repeat protein
MRRLGLAVLVLLFSPFTSVPADAQRLHVTVSGNVYFADESHPAKGVLVNLIDSDQSQLATEATDDSGRFEFRGLSPASYTVSINTSGYERYTTSVDMNFASDKGLEIYLKPLSSGHTSAKGRDISAHELSMPERARTLMDAGKKKLYQDKNAAGALEDFQQAVAAAAGYYEAYYQMGMAYLTLGKRADAETHFRKSIEVSSDKYSEAEVGLGTMMLDRNEYAQGEKTVRRGIELNPESWLGHYELGRALLIQNKISDALKCAEQAKSLAPSAPIVYRLLSNIHLREKDYSAVLEDIDAYIKLDPDSAAGIRAKQLREQVAQKVDTGIKTTSSTSK